MKVSAMAKGAAVLLAVMAGPGCQQDTVKAPYGGKQDPLPAQSYPQIAVDGPLQPFLAFDAPKVSRDGGVLKVVTPVRLQSDKGYESDLQYRYTFLDAGGLPLRSQADWRYVRLPSRRQVFLEGNAMDTTASDWRLEVRTAR